MLSSKKSVQIGRQIYAAYDSRTPDRTQSRLKPQPNIREVPMFGQMLLSLIGGVAEGFFVDIRERFNGPGDSAGSRMPHDFQ